MVHDCGAAVQVPDCTPIPMTLRHDTGTLRCEGRGTTPHGPRTRRGDRLQNVLERLTEWRRAERQRDDLPEGSPEWQLADEEVDRAHSAYRAEVAQATARSREADVGSDRDWWSPAAGAELRSTN